MIKVQLLTEKHPLEEIELPGNYREFCKKPDDEIIQVVAEIIKEDLSTKFFKVTRFDPWQSLHVTPKAIWGATGAAERIQERHNLSDEVTRDVAETLQAFYDWGVKAERQRQEEEQLQEE